MARRSSIASLMAAVFLGSLVAAQSETIAVEIKGGESRLVETRGSQIHLRFVSVVSDERCPALVTCSWANPPVIIVNATMAGNEPKDFQIAAGGPKGVLQGSYSGNVIQFLDLSPMPQQPSDFSKVGPLENYTVRLNIVTP